MANPKISGGCQSWWAWNGEMREEEILRQMQEFKDKGIKDFYIFPCSGLEVEYLSKEYFEKVAFTCKMAAKMGLKVWLYDEFNWPTGMAGGRVIEEHPEYRSKSLGYLTFTVDSTKTARLSLKLDEGEVLLAQADAGDGRRVDLRGAISNFCLDWGVPAGKWEVLIVQILLSRIRVFLVTGSAWSKGTKGYLDFMNPDAVREFINMTHESYARHIGKYFGSVVPGIFADEACLMRMPRPALPDWVSFRAFPWTAMLFEEFEKIKGYDFTQSLGLLLDDHKGPKLRYDLWDVAIGLYYKNYASQIARWCQAHDLLLVAHVLGEEPHSIWAHGGYYRAMKAIHIPGADYCYGISGLSNTHKNTHNDDFLNAKSIASAARQQGKAVTFCETFGLELPDITLDKMKDYADWQYFMGMDIITFYPSNYSLKGCRRRLLPGVFSYQAPWWKYAKVFVDYCHHLDKYLRSGASVTNCAILYPLTEFLCAKDHLTETAGAYLALARALFRSQVEFEVLSEEALDEARIENGSIILGKACYRVLFIPPLGFMPRSRLKILGEFIRGGGRIVACESDKALYMPDKDILEPGGLISSLSAFQSGAELYTIKPVFSRKDNETACTVFEDDIRQAAERLGIVTLIITEKSTGKRAKDVLVTKTVKGKSSRYMLFNTSPHDLEIETYFGRGDNISIYDAEKERYGPIRTEVSGDKRRASIFINGHTGLCLAVNDGRNNFQKAVSLKSALDKRLVECEAVVYPKTWEFHLDKPNALRFKEWQMADQAKPDVWYPTKEGKLPPAIHGRSGYLVKTSFTIEGAVPSDLRIVYERDRLKRLTINGQTMKIKGKANRYLDESSFGLAITPWASEGVNIIEAEIDEPAYETDLANFGYDRSELGPLYLIGSFAVHNSSLGKMRPQIGFGSWTKAGYPYYSGAALYAGTIVLNRIKPPVFLEADVFGGIASVKLNGQDMGCRPWRPYLFDVTDALQKGENKLEISITNSLANMLTQPALSGLKRLTALTGLASNT